MTKYNDFFFNDVPKYFVLLKMRWLDKYHIPYIYLTTVYIIVMSLSVHISIYPQDVGQLRPFCSHFCFAFLVLKNNLWSITNPTELFRSVRHTTSNFHFRFQHWTSERPRRGRFWSRHDNALQPLHFTSPLFSKCYPNFRRFFIFIFTYL